MTQRNYKLEKINLLPQQGADFIECKRPVFIILTD